MTLFDANVAIGRVTAWRGGFDGVDALKAEMRRLGIGGALVHHTTAAEADVLLGNRLVTEALRGQENLHACWVMTPPTLGDLPAPDAWVREARAQGVRAVRMFPAHSLYSFDTWCSGGLLGACEEASLPVFVDFGRHHWSQRVIPWDAIESVCRAYPALKLVVSGVTTGETRDAAAMLHRVSNLYLEYGEFITPDILGLMVDHGLGDRLLFGSGLPFRTADCNAAQTRHSGLSAEWLGAVSAGNACRLLGVATPSGISDMGVPGYAGPVIDMHTHSGAWERTITPHRDAAAIVRSMDRCGIDKVVLSSFAAIHGETPRGNRQTAELLGQVPGRLFGYAVINPYYPEETRQELDFCFGRSSGFVGLKLHCGLHGVQLEHPGYEEALVFADAERLPVLVHGGGQDRWEKVAARYPGASFIMAHACAWDGREPGGRALYGLARQVDNLYLDVAGSAAHHGAMAALVELAGARKILFGSDYPMFDFAFELGRVTFSELSADDKAAICAGNAMRLFRRLSVTQE